MVVSNDNGRQYIHACIVDDMTYTQYTVELHDGRIITIKARSMAECQEILRKRDENWVSIG